MLSFVISNKLKGMGKTKRRKRCDMRNRATGVPQLEGTAVASFTHDKTLFHVAPLLEKVKYLVEVKGSS